MTSADRMTIFPPDGNWVAKEGFLRAAYDLAGKDAVDCALHTLVPIFTADWAKEMSAEERAKLPAPHPFMWHFHHPGGIRELVELGLALLVTRSPPELTHDLTTSERYRSRSRELLAAAYIRSLGATLTFIPEGPGSKRPEFTATLDGSTFAVEVKGLDFGTQEHLHLQAALELQRRLQSIAAALPVSRASDVCFQLGPRAVARMLRDDYVDADAADELARKLGTEWARVVDEGAAPGVRPGPFDSKIVVYATATAQGHQFMIGDVRPASDNYVTRLGQRLIGASKKFAAFDQPGIIVLEPPFMGGVWPVDAVVALRRRLLGDAAWTEHVAAVILSETHAFASHHQGLEHGSDLRILQGKRWTELPRSLQLRWGASCACCSLPHDHFDLVTLVAKAASLIGADALDGGNDPTES